MSGRPVVDAGGTAAKAAVPSEKITLARVFRLVGDRMLRVEQEFDSYLRSEIPLIAEIGRYLSQSGGKRIRPALLLLAARTGKPRDDRDVLYAAVFELIHTATLVHDDIIDGADTRRGRRAVHGRWGNHVTVLLGDYLYIKSMNEALTADELRVIKVLADITQKMIEGELIQADCEGSLETTEERYRDIARRKTAYLFSGCCRVGAMVGGLAPEGEEALARFGMQLGLAFQITDDILDLTGSASELGKPVASDLREGKLTLPLIYLLQDGDEAVREQVAAVMRAGQFDRAAAAEIRALLESSGALGRARAEARAHADEALASLEALPPSEARECLQELPGLVLRRDR